MNLQKKSEFKKFVKAKLEDGCNIEIVLHGCNIRIANIKKKSVIYNQITCPNNEDFAKIKFNKYCKWLTDCEDETYTHYVDPETYIMSCNSKNDCSWVTSIKKEVTCKRCRKQMEG